MTSKTSKLITYTIAVLLVTSLPVAIKPSLAEMRIVQNSDVEVSGPNVNCDKPNAQVSSPKVDVSVPNPSRLVPNVGRILREGVGVPAPDTEAPDVEVPQIKTSSPDARCADADNSSNSPSSP